MPQLDGKNDPIRIIATTLLKDPQDAEEVYRAWMICCFIPWARTVPTTSNFKKPKFPKTVAAVVARKGIKADNKTTTIVEGAILNLSHVITTKANLIDWPDSAPTTLERKQLSENRELHGKALLRWGPHWRSTVIFALLVQVVEATNPSGGYYAIDAQMTRRVLI